MMDIEEVIRSVKYMLLPAPFIVKGYIGGNDAPSCNYEEYLVELFNQSTYFRQRSNGKPFQLIEKQDNGQPDICVDDFSLDFKLIAGQSTILAKRHTAQSIYHLAKGGVAYGRASGKKESYQAVRIHMALRDYTCDDFIELMQRPPKRDLVQHDVHQILKTLSVNKNLLLYLPYAIMVEASNKDTAKELVTLVLEDCFGSSVEYRERIAPDEETFLCCIHNQQALFFLCSGKKFKLIDSVNTSCSETFCRLSDYYFLDPYIIEAIIGSE